MPDIKQGKYILDMFPIEFVELNKEVSLHPGLMEYLAAKPQLDFYEKLAEIATYCGILVDGKYSREQLAVICHALIMDLRERRTGIIRLH